MRYVCKIFLSVILKIYKLEIFLKLSFNFQQWLSNMFIILYFIMSFFRNTFWIPECVCKHYFFSNSCWFCVWNTTISCFCLHLTGDSFLENKKQPTTNSSSTISNSSQSSITTTATTWIDSKCLCARDYHHRRAD